MSTLYYDVTSIMDARHGKMTGIQRVEYEVGKRLAAKGARIVAWDPWSQAFIDVDFERVIERIAQAQAMDVDDTLDEPAESTGIRPSRLLVGLLSRLAAIVPANWSRHDWIVLRALWTLAAEHPFMSPRDRRVAARRIGILSERRRTYEYLDALVARRRGILPSSGTGGPVAFAPGDSLVSLSIWWSEGPFDAIGRMDPERRVKLVSLIHDLVPIRRPEFLGLEAPRKLFAGFIHRLLRRGDRLCAVSRFVANDVEAYARETGVEIAPVVPIPLCSDMAERVVPTFTPRLDREALKPGHFVPLVSTINPRKNYHWAHEL